MTVEMENNQAPTKVFDINIKSFIVAMVMLALLMVATFVMANTVPHGEYARETIDGVETIVSGTYTQTEGGISVGKWLASPILQLGSEDGVTIIAISFFLLVIGGAFSALDNAGILSYMLGALYARFNDKKYKMLAVVTLCFMALGSLIGSFEETIPLVPLAVALSYALGWDALVGLGMSLMAVGCGFSCGLTNPFTVGVAQSIAGLPLFSGIWLRVMTFAIVYGLLMTFLNIYARRIEKEPKRSLVYDPENNARWTQMQYAFVPDAKKSKALRCFVITMVVGIALIIASAFISALSSIIMPVVGVVFLIAGTVTSLVSGMSGKEYIRWFGKGAVSVLPAVLLILMANSVKYTLVESKSLDTILKLAQDMTEGVPTLAVVLILYGITLLVNLFVVSGSAKAMLLIPLLMPLADVMGISRQLVVLSYVYGDGFSDLFFPTSPILLVALGLVGINFGKWVKWTWLAQLVILLLTAGLLALGYYVGY